MGPYRFSYKWGALVNLEKTPLEPYQGSTTLLREKAIISFEVITKTVPVLARMPAPAAAPARGETRGPSPRGWGGDAPEPRPRRLPRWLRAGRTPQGRGCLSRLHSGHVPGPGVGRNLETAGLAATALRAPAQPLGYTGSLCTISHSRRALTVWAHSSELEELATATLPERLLKVGEARRRGR